MDAINVVALRLMTISAFDRDWIVKRLPTPQSMQVRTAISAFEKQFGGKLTADLMYQINELLAGYSTRNDQLPDSEALAKIDLERLSDLYISSLRAILPSPCYSEILDRLPGKRRKNVVEIILKQSVMPLSDKVKTLLKGSLAQLVYSLKPGESLSEASSSEVA